jgi:dihydroorotase
MHGQRLDRHVNDGNNQIIDASHLHCLPGLIDPHVHFRIPGQAHKEDWCTAAQAAIYGGYTTVFDMPNNIPACISAERLQDKVQLIEQQLADVGIPLRYQLYLGADKNHFQEIAALRQQVIGLKIFMGSSTGDLLMDDISSLHAAFALAAAHNLMVAVHAEDHCMLAEQEHCYQHRHDFAVHSLIRNPAVAAKAVQTAVDLAECYGTRLYVLHVSSIMELEIIREAKRKNLPVYAETAPHYLFLTVDDFAQLGAKAQMNPALRSLLDQTALWEALRDGTIDTIGSDHAPHTLAEKDQPYRRAPSGVPGIETQLPLLLEAHHEGRLSLEKIVALTHDNIERIFDLTPNDDFILVNLQDERQLEEANLHSKCGWSPYHGRKLRGWPVYTILRNKVYALAEEY